MPAGSGTTTGDSAGSDRDPQVASKLVCRPATATDLRRYYGDQKVGTVRAMVAELDGEIVGIVGIVREPELGKVFSEFKPELRPYLKSITLLRAVKAAMRFVEAYRGPVVAVAKDAEGCRVLTRLGFTNLGGDLYGWLR